MTGNFETRSREETAALGERLAKNLRPGDVVALSGALGAGKTTLVKGLASGLGIAEPVTSPSFTIIQEYLGTVPLFHVDLYRIKAESELEDLGIEEYFDAGGVTVIEWPEKAAALLPPYTLAVGIQVLPGGERLIIVEAEDR